MNVSFSEFVFWSSSLISDNLFSKADSNNLYKMLKARLGDGMSIEMKRVEKIKKTISGKYKFIDSKIN